jgi:hypothetical protein
MPKIVFVYGYPLVIKHGWLENHPAKWWIFQQAMVENKRFFIP